MKQNVNGSGIFQSPTETLLFQQTGVQNILLLICSIARSAGFDSYCLLGLNQRLICIIQGKNQLYYFEDGITATYGASDGVYTLISGTSPVPGVFTLAFNDSCIFEGQILQVEQNKLQLSLMGLKTFITSTDLRQNFNFVSLSSFLLENLKNEIQSEIEAKISQRRTLNQRGTTFSGVLNRLACQSLDKQNEDLFKQAVRNNVQGGVFTCQGVNINLQGCNISSIFKLLIENKVINQIIDLSDIIGLYVDIEPYIGTVGQISISVAGIKSQ